MKSGSEDVAYPWCLKEFAQKTDPAGNQTAFYPRCIGCLNAGRGRAAREMVEGALREETKAAVRRTIVKDVTNVPLKPCRRG